MVVSGSQLFWIIVTTEVIAMLGLRISPAILMAKQDAWISMLAGGGLGMLLTALTVNLSKLHPKQTVTQFSQALLGKWLGRVISIPYLLVWSLLTAGLLRSFSDFLHLILVDRTPLWMIMLLLTGLMVYMTYSAGITGIGRYCELMGPIIVITLFGSFVLNAGNIDLHHLLPVYSDSGWMNIAKGSLGPAFWYPGPFSLLVIPAFMPNLRKALSRSLLGCGVTVLMLTIATLMVLLIFGANLSSQTRFPYFMYVRTIDIFNFIQNVDIFIIFIWIFGVTAQLSLYLFMFSYEASQWVLVKDWRKIVWFAAPGVYIIAMMIPNETILSQYDKLWVNMVFPVCGILIPMLLWCITAFKNRARKSIKPV
jgi:spore germination protein KB